MKRVVMTILGILFSAAISHAQSFVVLDELPLTHSPSLQAESSLLPPPQQGEERILPEARIPVLPNLQDGPAPCPAGVGKPCALLGGRLYFNDPAHMTEHNRTLWQAMRNPMLLTGGIINLAATVADIEGTEACIHAHTCTEANPMFGKHPGRASFYGVGMPLSFVNYLWAAHLKKEGKGNWAFGLMWVATTVHIYEAAQGFAAGHNGPSSSPSSLTKKSMGIAFKL
jgi:hypothetical protein